MAEGPWTDYEDGPWNEYTTGQKSGRTIIRQAVGLDKPKASDAPPWEDYGGTTTPATPTSTTTKTLSPKEIEDIQVKALNAWSLNDQFVRSPEFAAKERGYKAKVKQEQLNEQEGLANQKWAGDSMTPFAMTGKLASETVASGVEMADMGLSLAHMLAMPGISIAGAMAGKSQEELDKFNAQFATPLKNVLTSLGVDPSLINNEMVAKTMQLIDEKGLDPAAEILGNMLHLDTEANPNSKALLKNSLMLGIGPLFEGAKALKPKPKPKAAPEVDVKAAADSYIKANMDKPLKEPVQGELDLTRTQGELDFGNAPKPPAPIDIEAARGDMTTALAERATELSERQGQLPLEYTKGTTPDMFAPLTPDPPVVDMSTTLSPYGVKQPFATPGMVDLANVRGEQGTANLTMRKNAAFKALGMSESGMVDIGGILPYTETGFKDLVESLKRGSKAAFDSVKAIAPAIASEINASAFKEPDGTLTPFIHGTNRKGFDRLQTGSDGLIHFGTLGAASTIRDRHFFGVKGNTLKDVPDFPSLPGYVYDRIIEEPRYTNLPREVLFAKVKEFLKDPEGSQVFREQFNKDFMSWLEKYKKIDSPAAARAEVNLDLNQRPLWSSAKKPIMMPDLGGWFHGELMDYLLGRTDQRSGAAGVTVLPFEQQLKNAGLSKGEISRVFDKIELSKDVKDIYQILEDVGFDAIVYPNNVENLNSAFSRLALELGIKPTFDTIYDSPSFSVAVWKPELVHEWARLPKSPKPFPSKGQGGYIDVGSIYDSFKKYFGDTKGKVKKYDEEMLNRYLPKYSTLKEALDAAVAGEQNKDIGILQRDLDVGQQSKNKQLNNVLTAGYWNIRNIDFDTIKLYKEQVQYVVAKAFDSIDKKNQANIARVMTTLQKPSIQAFLDTLPDKIAPDAMLQQMGLSVSEIAAVKTLRPLMETIKNLENQASIWLRGKPLVSNVKDYWPLSSGGKFLLMATHPEGTFDIKGFSTIKELAAVEKAAMKENATKGLGIKLERMIPDQKTAPFDEIYMASMVMEAVDKATGRPKEHPLSAIAQKMEEAREQYKRTFEMARTKQDMTDWLGDFITNKSKGERLLDAFHNRLFQSFQFYKNARIINEVLRPLGDENYKPLLNQDLPNTFYDLRNRAAREAGLNISTGQELGRTVDNLVNKVTVLKENMMGRKIKEGEFIIKPSSFKKSIAYANAFSTTMALALKPLFLAQQATTAFSMPIIMYRELAPFGFNPKDLTAANLSATMKTGPSVLAFAHEFATGKKSNLPVIEFLRDAYDKGWISAHLWDDLMPGFTTKKARGQGPIATGLGKVRKFTVDKIEGVTNANSLAYYYHAVGALFPDITKERHYELAYDLAKSHTGEYKKYNQPLVYERYTAQIGGQFQTWTHNLLSKNIQELQLAAGAKGNKMNLTPFVYGMAAAYVLAGLYGMPGIVEYEVARDAWDKQKPEDAPSLPPMDVIMGDLGIPYEVRQAQLMDRVSPWNMDLSTSMRYSSFLEMRLLAADLGINMVKAINTLRKEVGLTFEGEPAGITTADRAAMSNAMPAGLPFTPMKMRNAIFDTVDDKLTGTGTIVNKYGQRNYSFDTTEELILNSLGIKNQRQRKELKTREVDRYLTMKEDKSQKALVKTIVDQAYNGDISSMEKNLNTYVTKYAASKDSDVFLNSLDEKIAEAALKRKLTLEQMRMLEAAKSSSIANQLKNKRINERMEEVLR